ncbi:BadF/BadG/BcrA/BcrD ATPase family protein [Nocardia terpenica]|uniref:BadF/BadG/BcrA/BcrD ATPase family protein n=1 Tax=Nocardia terpenica TaxID=455432 RepID=UPI00142DD6A0|nr:BadF/BadG/BcrA/BcrD ATPase family protein [Nocardia terpenica]
MIPAILAIDLGKTGCRGSLRLDGVQKDYAETAGAPGLAAVNGVSAAARAIAEVITQIVDLPPDFTISVGSAGAASAPEAAARLARQLAELPGVLSVAVTSDAVTAHVGALGGSPGVVLAAGTGAVATAVDETGRFVRIDGWGPLLGDEGSGGWIGTQGLRAVLRAHDGRAPHTVLEAKVGECYGISPDELPRHLGGQDNPTLLAARFAPVVAEAAAVDDTAAAIMAEAAQALARTVFAAVERCGLRPPVPYTIIGGLTKLGVALTDPLNRAIAPVVRYRRPHGDPVDGAALLGSDTTTVLETQVIRCT